MLNPKPKPQTLHVLTTHEKRKQRLNKGCNPTCCSLPGFVGMALALGSAAAYSYATQHQRVGIESISQLCSSDPPTCSPSISSAWGKSSFSGSVSASSDFPTTTRARSAFVPPVAHAADGLGAHNIGHLVVRRASSRGLVRTWVPE